MRLNDILIDNAEYNDRNGITVSASSLYTPVKEIIFEIGDIPFEVKTKYITNRIICLEPIKKNRNEHIWFKVWGRFNNF